MSLKGKRIFLLEDDPVNFSIILTILRRNGVAPIHDHWGDTTLSKIVRFTPYPDLILLDIMLPGNKDGYDVLAAIQAMPELEGIPVVAVSASEPNSEIPKAKEKGFNSYISKPINRHRFPKQLLAILDGEEIWE